MKYRVERIGSIIVEADSEEEARQIANESSVDKWEWNEGDAEEDW